MNISDALKGSIDGFASGAIISAGTNGLSEGGRVAFQNIISTQAAMMGQGQSAEFRKAPQGHSR